jgi:hypothetical protein
MRAHRGRLHPALPLLAVALLLPACGSKHRLGHHDFASRTLAATWFPAPSPELLTRRSSSGGGDPVAVVVAAGSRVAVELEGRRARARLDSAATRLDVAARVAARTQERAGRYLGARPVQFAEAAEGAEGAEGADYLLEVDIRSFGIDARGRYAELFVRGEVVLLEARTGREIWSRRVLSRGPLTPAVAAGGLIPPDAVTAGALATLSVAEFQDGLERLADLAADWMTRELREDLRKVRGRR